MSDEKWTVEHLATNVAVVCIDGDVEKEVCAIHGVTDEFFPYEIERINKLAAANDLLAACKIVLDMFEINAILTHQQITAVLEPAIAKAEGK